MHSSYDLNMTSGHSVNTSTYLLDTEIINSNRIVIETSIYSLGTSIHFLDTSIFCNY